MGFLMGLLVGTFLGMVILSLCIMGEGADAKKKQITTKPDRNSENGGAENGKD